MSSSSKQDQSGSKSKPIKVKVEPTASSTPSSTSASSRSTRTRKSSNENTAIASPQSKVPSNTGSKYASQQIPVTPVEKITNSVSPSNLKTPQQKGPSKFLISTANLDLMEPYDTPLSEDTPTRKRNPQSEIKVNPVHEFPEMDEDVPVHVHKRVKIAPLPVDDVIVHEPQMKSKPKSTPAPMKQISHEHDNSKKYQSHHSNKPKRAVAPPPFKPTEESLIESKGDLDLIDAVFKNIDDRITRDQYTTFANLSFKSWVNKGFEITSKKHELVKKIVVIRSKANMKFNFIFQLINNYGNSLENTDNELQAKMIKLQKLGQEIKSFIS
ncbi:hypothetical protein WICPIJ_001929 [Wickerhamomyces pijperi]|uniref:Extracellular mutant protein 11 C-terminal domain-containing protein n=1 Tax=Wickerhamomyces pijperi TaxID=599730 RepID=A0A9P8QCP0_WICPI|nr:hypothetical protein WICPIJ_001929 [Wickerhamomyces pijperi]